MILKSGLIMVVEELNMIQIGFFMIILKEICTLNMCGLKNIMV